MARRRAAARYAAARHNDTSRAVVNAFLEYYASRICDLIDDDDSNRRPAARETDNRGRRSIVEKTPKLATSARVLQLTQRFGLNLADALARDRELLADFL